MSHTARPRSLPTLWLATAVLAGGAFGVLAPSVAHATDGDAACTTKKFHYPAVEKACKDGGRKAAKDLMKAAVKKARDGGKPDIKCTSCHEDTKEFKLKDNAVTDLKPWI
jgi:hypothetical protein